MGIKVDYEDKNRLVGVVAELAAVAPVSNYAYFKNLVNRARLPRAWQVSLSGAWVGDPKIDARMLIDYLLARDVNPADPRVTSLGELLRVLLQDQELGLDTRSLLAAVIHRNQLFVDAGLMNGLILGYQIPEPTMGAIDGKGDYGPSIDWIGPEGELELQSFLQPKPEFLDLGFVARGIERAASVCRIEIESTGTTGTGFVIARGLVLTNHHVIDGDAAARSAVLRFGRMSTGDGKESAGQAFKLDGGNPILRSSPPNALDYALLKLEPAAATLAPVPTTTGQDPTKGAPIHILQHPRGEAMKLASSQNGVTAVATDRGLLQYVTSAAGGSSGAPCFNDQWQAVALHHAERSVGLATRREGILLSAIHEKIQDLTS